MTNATMTPAARKIAASTARQTAREWADATRFWIHDGDAKQAFRLARIAARWADKALALDRRTALKGGK
jgi:hypothetical protein